MKLSDWLLDNADIIYSDFAEKNKTGIDRGALSRTARAQVISALGELRDILLPGVYETTPSGGRYPECRPDCSPEKYHGFSPAADAAKGSLYIKLESAAHSLCAVVNDALVHECLKNGSDIAGCAEKAEAITAKALRELPAIKAALDTDMRAAYEGDPAAKSLEEVVLAYPSIEAVSVYRIAHLLETLNVPIIPRIMTEYAHKNTGIDIHPGAAIGNSFFIDHGTGVVIGETCTIGSGVKLYQGVTLGAKSFPLDERGNPVKGIKRHPDIEDNVVVYAGATILGGNTRIGHDSVIGGNVWLTESIPPYSSVFNSEPSPFIKRSDRRPGAAAPSVIASTSRPSPKDR